MPKTKSQAEKNKERELKLQQVQAEQHERSEARHLEFLKKQEEAQLSKTITAQAEQPLSKKALRQQKKQLAQQAHAEAFSNHEKEAISFFEEIPKNIVEKTTSKKADEAAIALAAHDINYEESSKQKNARLVQNHSTYCEGLKPVLIRLQKALMGCTIIPGKLTQCATPYEGFDLRIQRVTNNNTYKLVARSGKTTQDVAIQVTDPFVFTAEVLTEAITAAIEKVEIDQVESTSALGEFNPSTYNRTRAEFQQSFWKNEHQQQHLARQQSLHEQAQAQAVKDQMRKLKTKGLKSEEIEDYAERDVAILSGKERTKHSMK